jgi:hypothetical protein
MIKKTFALVTLVSFVLFSCSCIQWKKTPLLSVEPEKRPKIKICAVQVHSGKITEFSKDSAATIQVDSVIGMGLVKNFKLETPKIKQPLRLKEDQVYEIISTEGVSYTTYHIIAQDDSGVTFDGYYQVSIPLADVDFAWIRRAMSPGL